jgi:hypothetical protein
MPIAKQWKYYRNGELMESFDSDGAPSNIPDVNNWLGARIGRGLQFRRALR